MAMQLELTTCAHDKLLFVVNLLPSLEVCVPVLYAEINLMEIRL